MSTVTQTSDDAAAGEQVSAGPVSIIGADIVVTGNIDATVDLQIEGRVIGDVRCATLVLGPESSIEGNIRAERVRVSGSVKGSIEARDLAVEASASVSGDVVYERLRIASGGAIEGTLRRSTGEEGAAEAAKLKLVQPPQPQKPQDAVYIE